MSMNINGNINMPLGGFGPKGVNDISENELPQGGVPRAEDEEIVLDNPEPKKDISAHAAFVDRLFQKAVETNRTNVTLQQNELKGVCKAKKGRAAAAEAECARAKAETAMTALDRFTGRQLVEAFRAPGFEASEPGKALFDAIRAQMALADSLSACSRASGGVPALEEMSMQANLRAAELSRLMGELDRAADENQGDARLDSAGLSSDLSRIGAEAHGNRDALSHLERQLGLEELDAFSSENKDLTPEQVMTLRKKLGELKAKVEDARKNGIDYVGDGKGRTMVDPAVFRAIQAELGKMASRLDRHETKFVSTALERFADEVRPPDFISDLAEFAKTNWKSPNASQNAVIKDVDGLIASFKKVRDDLKALVKADLEAGRAPDRKKYEQLRDKIEKDLVDETVALCRKIKSGAHANLPESVAETLGKDGGILLEKDAQAVASAVKVLRYVADEIFDAVEHWTDPKTSAMSVRKDDVRALMYDGKVSLNDHIEARVHGLPDSAVDAEVSGLEPISVEPLGSGSSSTVYLCTFEKDGQQFQRVFKPELPAHCGLDMGIRGICSGKVKFQTALSFNMATRKVSELLGVGERNMQAKIGTLKGRFGMFLEVAPGESPNNIVFKGKSPFGAGRMKPDDFTARNARALRNKLPDSDAHKQKLYALAGEVARQLNELQWLDIITGQLDRHDMNYNVSLPNDMDRKDEVRVTGIDNDASFPEDINEAGVVVVQFDAQKAVLERFRSASSRDIEEYFEGRMKTDPKTGNWTFDLQGMDELQRHTLMTCAGVRSGLLPTVVNGELAEKISYLATDPEGQRRFEDELRQCGLTDRQIEAAKGRLASADTLIKNKSVKVLNGEEWGVLAEQQVVQERGFAVAHNSLSFVTGDYFLRYRVKGLFTGVRMN